MGSSAKLKAQFLTNHPICCFCGGVAPSVEPDHIPSRVFFKDRQWPEGYIFPACVSCNRATRYDEQIVAMLARLSPFTESEIEQNEMQQIMTAVARNHPEIIQELHPSVRQIRRAIRQYGLEVPQGVASIDLPMLSVSGPLINSAVESFGRKLFLALYYKHTGNILSVEGGVALKWFANIQLENGAIPDNLMGLLGGVPELVRNTTMLNEQFFYRYVVTDTNRDAAFLVFFRKSFGMLGWIKHDGDFSIQTGATILRPFNHQ